MFEEDQEDVFEENGEAGLLVDVLDYMEMQVQDRLFQEGWDSDLWQRVE